MDPTVMPDLHRNAVRLQLHALAYNLGNFMRTLAMPKTAPLWSLTSLREKLIKIGAKVVSHGRYVTFHMWTAPSSQGVCSALIRSLASICPACLYARTGTLAKMVSATRVPNKWATS